MKRPAPTLWDLSLNVLALSLEAQQVIALRLAHFATGADLHGHEAVRMVTEKAHAVLVAQQEAAVMLTTGDVAGASDRTIAHYRRTIRANRRRLSRA